MMIWEVIMPHDSTQGPLKLWPSRLAVKQYQDEDPIPLRLGSE